MSVRGCCWLFVGVLPVYLGLAALLPPFDDELYYWCWSRDLQLSYYDHPPMVAYLIRAATELCGDGIVAVRLPAVLSAAVVAVVIARLSRPVALLPLILASPVLTFAAVMVTPDTPLLVFWALYLVWLVAVHERLAAAPVPASWWLLGGLILGCGVLGKYTMGLAAISGGVSFLFAGNPRRWAVGYAVHALVSVAVASPILIHNLRHDFVPLTYQWGHAMSSPQPGLAPFAEFVGVQIALAGTLPLTVFLWGLRNRSELLAEPRWRVCLCLFALPFAFFLLKATRGKLEGNWAFPCYLACWPLAAEWYRRVRDSAGWWWATRAGFLAPVLASALFLAHLVHPLPVFSPEYDRVTRQWEQMAVARSVVADLRAAGYAGPVFAPTYQWTAVLRWHGVEARQIDGWSRPSHFTERDPGAPHEPGGVVFTEGPERPTEFPGFGPARSAACYLRVVRGVRLEPCWLLDCSDRGGRIAPAGEVAGAGRLDRHPAHPPR